MSVSRVDTYNMSRIVLFLLLVTCYYTDAVDLTVAGLCPAAYTPFDDDGKLNLDVVPAYAKYLKNNSIDGVLLAGTSGEGPALSLAERKKLLDAWIRVGKNIDLKVVMQVGGQSLPHVLELAQYAETVGADAIMTLPELYYRPTSDSAVVRYMEMVSNAAPKLPILYYHHPSMSGVNVNIVKFFKKATATIPNFKGMKCDFASALNIVASGLLHDDQRLFMMSHLTAAPSHLMGFNSSMTAVINIFPKLFMAIEEALGNKDIGKARLLQEELNERVAVITSLGEYVPFSKATMEIISGIRVGSTRDPLMIVSPEQRRALEEGIQAINAKYSSE